MNIEYLSGSELEYLPQFAVSLGIGLLIGLDREQKSAASAGLRTFALVAMFGTLMALLSEKVNSPWLLAIGLAIVALMTISAHNHAAEANADPGTTTVIAIIICYGLGSIVWHGYSTLAIMLAIITTILLYFKTELQGISRNLGRRDLVSILQFAVLTFIILPILPDKNFGPYNAINPYQVWLMVVLISGVSLAGYIALRLVGQRYGTALLGSFGGLVSSTATTLVYARRSKYNLNIIPTATVIILIANLVVLIRLSVFSAVVSQSILPQLLPVLGSGLLLGLGVTAYCWQKIKPQHEMPAPEIKNPAEMQTAATFGLLYAIVLFLAAWLSDIVGSRGLYAVALASGLTDVDAITLTSLRLFEIGKLEATETVIAISLGILSNIAFKFGLIFFIGGSLLAKQCALGMIATGIGIGLGLIVFL
ncbi:MAG: hypothetical protein NMNS01_18670 [Nitrosomonas sp.]|nr:MAG: hypothetical protein NMNS01_18670 [Nitrosomonas sp.]